MPLSNSSLSTVYPSPSRAVWPTQWCGRRMGRATRKTSPPRILTLDIVMAGLRSQPGPNESGGCPGDEAGDQHQKDRHRQIELLLELLDPCVLAHRLAPEHGAKEQEQRDRR